MKNLHQSTETGLLIGTATRNKLIAAGPLTKQPETLPYRIVLIANGPKFTVHTEYFDDSQIIEKTANAQPGDPILAESSLSGGNYFNADELVKATIAFAERLAKNAEYIQSIYREVAA
jgi:hypothetical protein